METFFETVTLQQVHQKADELHTLESRVVCLAEAAGRTLAEDLTSPQDLPGFTRATMDGFAVRGRDTFGVSESAPGYLTLAGEVRMGRAPDFTLGPGRCARIGTGGMLPEGADAVIMVEHTRQVDDSTVEVTRPVAPGANTLGPTDDASRGEVLLEAGHRIRPQDVGLMAALGVTDVPVVRSPEAGIISTGDEVVEATEQTAPGQVRDVNTYTLSAQVREAGGRPRALGLVGDHRESLRGAVEDALDGCDLVLLSGGSSVGVRDLTREVFQSFPSAELLVHGVSVAPGKPFIWVRCGRKHLLGLPGQVASCMVAFHLFVEPIIERLLGRGARSFTRFAHARARLDRNVAAAPGREVYLRVGVKSTEEGLVATPILGKSGVLRTLTRARGILRIPLGSEGLEAGTPVTVMLFP